MAVSGMKVPELEEQQGRNIYLSRSEYLSTTMLPWMIGMSRFKPLHERRPSMWSLAQTEIKDLSLVRTKGATFFYKERASFTATW